MTAAHPSIAKFFDSSSFTDIEQAQLKAKQTPINWIITRDGSTPPTPSSTVSQQKSLVSMLKKKEVEPLQKEASSAENVISDDGSDGDT